jgi:hypothetical protein
VKFFGELAKDLFDLGHAGGFLNSQNRIRIAHRLAHFRAGSSAGTAQAPLLQNLGGGAPAARLNGPNPWAAAKLIPYLGLFPGFRLGDRPFALRIRASGSLHGVFVALAIDLGEEDTANPGL